MFISRIKLKNWRNFREVDVNLREYTYLLGANASGKSNLLDVFRFLRDISKHQGGGLQAALQKRGGLSKLRCLHARNDPEIEIEIFFKHNLSDKDCCWRYVLAFRHEGTGAQRVIVTKEQVWKNKSKKPVLDRPDSSDDKDPELKTETHLEQKRTNAKFREIADFFNETTYLHLVPQLLKYSKELGGYKLEDDPFGQGFLEKIAATYKNVRDSRLNKIQRVLEAAIPQFAELKFEQDDITGHPHLAARYVHYRPRAGWQREDQFSDGTLRLIGLMWSLIENNSLLLLEEPELSLNDAIVRRIPFLFHRIQRETSRKRQIIISTHSEALLENKGIDLNGVLFLEVGSDGTKIRHLDNDEINAINSGFSIGEIVLPKTGYNIGEQLNFIF